MTFLNLTLSILGILFVIWLYALVFAENVPTINLNKIEKFWDRHKDKRFIDVVTYLFNKFFQLLRWIGRVLKRIFKFIAEVIAEIIFNMLIRGIWWLIKSLFVLLGKIFN